MAKKKSKKQNAALEKSSNRLAYASGAVGGLSGASIASSLLSGRPVSKLANAARIGGIGLSFAHTVQNWRRDTGVGDKIGTEIGNAFRQGLTASAVAAASIMGGTKLKAMSKAARAARMAKAGTAAKKSGPAAAKVVNKGQVIWRKIRGRIIPIRMKDVK